MRRHREPALTAEPRPLDADVLALLAGVLVQLTRVAVVAPVAAAHGRLGPALAAQRAHALGRQAVRRRHARAAEGAVDLGAGVGPGCRTHGERDESRGSSSHRQMSLDSIHSGERWGRTSVLVDARQMGKERVA